MSRRETLLLGLRVARYNNSTCQLVEDGKRIISQNNDEMILRGEVVSQQGSIQRTN